MANNTGTFFNINDNDGIPLVGVSTDGKVMINHLYGNCLIGSTSVTGTASQPLQVTGGAYVSGSVGIGTTNPSYKFDLLDTDTDVVRFRGTNSGVRFQSNSTTMDIVSHNGSDSNTRNLLIRQYGASTGILLDTNNNVGIGTINPGYKLDVHGSAAFTTGVFFHPSGVVKAAINVAQTANQGVNGTAVDDTYQWTTGGKILWSTDNGVTPNLVLNSTGNVGIGTTNPSASLEIKKDVGSQIVNLLKLTNSSTAGDPGQSIVFQGYYNSAVISAFQTPTFSLGGNLQLQTYNGSNTLNTGILLNKDGNVGIGTATPIAKLDVSGDVRVSGVVTASDTTLISLDGTSAVRQRFFPSSGTGNFNWQIAAQTNVNNGFEITPSSASGGSTFSTPAITVKSDGKVGIGVTGPTRQLDVNKTAIFDSSGDGTTTNPSLAIGSSEVGFSYIGGQQLAFITNSTEKLRITSAGLVGIGTSSPSADGPLTLTNSTTTNPTIFFERESTNYNGAIQCSAYGTITFYNGADSSVVSGLTPRMTIDGQYGRVGIGVTSPGAKLHVNTGTNENLWVGSLGGSGAGVYLASVNDSTSTNQPLQIGSASVINFAINGTEAARIDSSRRLLVGTSSSTGLLSNTAPVIAGLFKSFDDAATFTTGVAQTLFTIPNTDATYIITLRRGAVGDVTNYQAVSILSANATPGGSVTTVLTALKTAGNVSISISGTNLQGTQTSGGAASLQWVVTRVG
jgi:hypothetical protein